MYQSLYTALQFNKCTVVCNTHNLVSELFPNCIFFFHPCPRVGGNLFIAKRYLLILSIILQYHHLNCIAYCKKLGWMAYPPPCYIGYVKQSINTTEVNKRTIFCNILYSPVNNLALFHS